MLDRAQIGLIEKFSNRLQRATTDNSRNAVRQDASHAEQAAEASRLTSALSPPWLPEPVDQKKQASCCLAPGRG